MAKLGGGHVAHHRVDGLAAHEHDQRGNRDDAEPGGELGLLVDVALEDREAAVELVGDLLASLLDGQVGLTVKDGRVETL